MSPNCTKCAFPIAAGQRHLRETVTTSMGELPIVLCASCATYFTGLAPGQLDEIHRFTTVVRLRAMLEHAERGEMGSA
jgi:hypothetical protein